MTNAMMPALAGADIMSGVGGMESGLSAGFEGAVIDDEMIGLMKHVVQGCEVNEETLAFDVMREVILTGGAFLGEMHTVKQMRSGAIWLPGVSERAIRRPTPGALWREPMIGQNRSWQATGAALTGGSGAAPGRDA